MRATYFNALAAALLSSGLVGCEAFGFGNEEAAGPPSNGTAPETGNVLQIATDKPVGEVHPGDMLEWSISDSSPSVESGTEWSKPTVNGDAVVYVLTLSDQGKMAGSSPVNTHKFRAIKPGKATIRSVASSFGDAPVVVGEPAPADATPSDLVIEVEVTAP